MKLLSTILLLIVLTPTLAFTAYAADDDATADSTASEGAATEEDAATENTTNYSIPKPDFLPGLGQDAQPGAETQDRILNETIPRAINIAIGILGIGAFISILVSAVLMLTSFGNEDKLNRAKTNLQYSLLGFVLIVFAYAIISIIVAIALPKEETDSTSWLIPKAYAAGESESTTDADALNTLFPSQEVLIEQHDDQGRVSLPSGDLISEIVPGIVTNILYAVGFLIFISFMYGGTLMIIGRGNDEMTTKAKNIVIYAGIALGIIATGYAIIYGIATIKLQDDPSTDSDNVYVDTEE